MARILHIICKRSLLLLRMDFISPYKMNGHLEGIELVSFLQILQMDCKTCRVIVHSNGHNGILDFNEGELVNASTGDIHGEDAAIAIMSWDNPLIELRSGRNWSLSNINQSLFYILLEAARLKDENTKKTMEDSMTIDEKIFGDISSITGFIAAGVYFANGELISATPSKQVDLNHLGGLSVELHRYALSMTEKIKIGYADFVEVHSGTHVFMYESIVPDVAALNVMMKRDGNVGLMKYEMKKLAKSLSPRFDVSHEKDSLMPEKNTQSDSDASQILEKRIL